MWRGNLLFLRPWIIRILVVLCSVVCCSPKNVDVTNVSGPGQRTLNPSSSGQQGTDSKGNIDNSLGSLIAALRAKYDVDKVFAWAGSETNGRIMWSNREGCLRFINFTTDGGEYRFAPDNENRIEDRWGTLLPAPTLAPLSQLVTDAEFPVRLDTIEVGNCTARLILVWQAENRSFSPDRRSDRTLAMPALRVVLSKGDMILSNSINNFECRKPREVLVEDINNDGIKDYCFIGDVEPVIYLWTVTDECSLQSLSFLEKDEGTIERTDFLEGRRIDVTKQNDRQYLIHVWHKKQFKTEYIEDVYQWNQSEGAFIWLRNNTRHSR